MLSYALISPCQRKRCFAPLIENEKPAELRLCAISGLAVAVKEGLRSPLLVLPPGGSDVDDEDATGASRGGPAGAAPYFLPQPFSASFSWYFSA